MGNEIRTRSWLVPRSCTVTQASHFSYLLPPVYSRWAHPTCDPYTTCIPERDRTVGDSVIFSSQVTCSRAGLLTASGGVEESEWLEFQERDQWPCFHEGAYQNSSCDTVVSDEDRTSYIMPRGQQSTARAVQSPQWLGLVHGSQC